MDAALIGWLPSVTKGLIGSAIILAAASLYKGFTLYHHQQREDEIRKRSSEISKMLATIVGPTPFLPSQMTGAEHARIDVHSTASPDNEQFINVPVVRRKTATDTKVATESPDA